MFQYVAANTGTKPDETGPQTAVEEAWSYHTGGDACSTPAVVDGTVYLGDNEGGVYALSARTGSEQWTASIGPQLGVALFPSPAVVDGTVYIGSTDGSVYAFSSDDSIEEWAYETGDGVQ